MSTQNRLSGLKVDSLRKRIGTFTLSADFEVLRGERAALIGPSGSGKTSLLRLIAGLDLLEATEDSGTILLGSEDITFTVPERRQVGFVFQEQALFPSLNVMDNATFALRMRGLHEAERNAQVMPWLERVGLRDKAQASVGILSGGERQRVAFVRAVVWKPRVLLLDEPFSALDASLRDVLRRELVELHRLWPVPLLLVSHDEKDLDSVATRRIRCEWDLKTEVRRFVG